MTRERGLKRTIPTGVFLWAIKRRHERPRSGWVNIAARLEEFWNIILGRQDSRVAVSPR